MQGGFRTLRGATDQALCLHELCVNHTLDYYGSLPEDKKKRKYLYVYVTLSERTGLRGVCSVYIHFLPQQQVNQKFFLLKTTLGGVTSSDYLIVLYLSVLLKLIKNVK